MPSCTRRNDKDFALEEFDQTNKQYPATDEEGKRFGGWLKTHKMGPESNSETPVVEEPVKVPFPYNLALMSAESRCPLPNSTKLNTQRPTALSKMSASVSKLFRP
ncbi:hypothetical protein AOXY_G12095 [Acipenser oxyrinchus oxyrinchus]|uniref:Uncharacterized protein n=1 Tax=Acipenser oxyrinchus oxyrinchus TaxID=40147 RepID=A0AAD8G4B7_ACIOX|nr:hypothetical protein AOXY_G12095 [Acipenser oxyrinchus oxyrinchus]